MIFSTIKSLAAVALVAVSVTAQSDTTPVTGKLGNATIVTNNPGGAGYVASLIPTSNSNIQGSVLALTSSDHTGVNFQVALSGLPSEGGPFRKPSSCARRFASNLLTWLSLPHSRQPYFC